MVDGRLARLAVVAAMTLGATGVPVPPAAGTLKAAASGAAAAGAAVAGGTTTLINRSNSGRQVVGYHGDPFWVSADGRYVGFSSISSDLAPGDTGSWDLFIRDRRRGITTRIPIRSADSHLASSMSMSGDGRYLAFESSGATLVPGDTNGHTDVFLRDLRTATTRRVSVSSAGGQGDNESLGVSVSDDGRYVAFGSAATNLVPGDTNRSGDVFVHDVRRHTTTRVSVSSAERQADQGGDSPTISADGRFVTFTSLAWDLVAGEPNATFHVYQRDLRSGTTVLVSRARTGALGNGASVGGSMSDNGRYVTYSSFASNLVAGDTNGSRDVFMWDRRRRLTTRVSLSGAGRQGNSRSAVPSISADGRYVAFASVASNLVKGDSNADWDIFVRDRVANTTRRVSVSTGGRQGEGSSTDPVIDRDGRYVAFYSDATGLVPGDVGRPPDVFLRSLQR